MLAVLLAACGAPASDKLLETGKAQMAKGESAAALITARSLLADDPEHGPGRLLLARALLAQGDLFGAETELQRAGNLGVPAAELALPQARLWLAQRRPQAVVDRFGAALGEVATPAAAADAAELRTLVAQAHLDLGNLAAARTQLDRTLAAAPAHLPALLLRARVLAKGGDMAAALALAEGLTQSDGTVAATWQLRGELLAREGRDPATALKAMRAAVQLDPRNAEAHAALVTFLLGQRDFAAARTQVGELRRVMPALPLTHYLDALVAFLAGDLAVARDRTQHLLKFTEPQPQVLLLAGMAQARLGGLAQAEAHLGAAVAAAPTWTVPRRELAAVHLQLGQPERALAVLEPLFGTDNVRTVPLEQVQPQLKADDREGLADLWLLAGQAHARRADFRSAEAAFARARQMRPADPALRAAAAKLDLAAGRSELGLRELQAAASADADGVGADLALISALMQRGDRPAALKALAAASAKQPKLPVLPYLRGRILAGAAAPAAPAAPPARGGAPRAGAERAAERAAEREQARAAYEQALVLEPRFRPAVDALAALDLEAERPDAARQRYQALLKLEPNSAPTVLALAELTLRTGARPPEVVSLIDRSVRADPKDASNWRAAVDLQRRLGDPAATLSRAQAAAAALPDDADLMLALADAQQMAGETAQSLTSVHKAVKQRPNSPEAQLRLAIAYGLLGQTAAAREPMARALELAPDAPGVLHAAVRLAVAERQEDRARALARGQQQRRPQQAIGWQLEAAIEAALGRPAQAAAAWRVAYDKQPTPEHAVQLHRGLLAADAAGAAAFAKNRQASHPADALFLAHLAETAAQAGDTLMAEAHYRRVLALQPDQVLALNNLAEILIRRRDREALTLAQRAARLQPQLAAVQDTLASAHAAAGQPAPAVQAQERAVELQPRDLRLRLHLAQHLASDGKRDKAADELRHVMAQGGAAPALRAEAEALLKKIGG